ncbi:c-type cytochrome [Afifella sp. YEN Y35]|uniref:c-type cytochrome n=1 Tax=Afifella sp. YEN Y35 TaxID=3388337 RepID=UPI0039DF2B57
MMRRLLLSLAVLAAPSLALAQSPQDVADARIGYFRLLGLEMHDLAAMAKGEKDYDAEAAKTHAANLEALTHYSMAGLLAPGTSNEDLPGKTRALPAIWDDMDGMHAKAEAYVAAVQNLNTVAGEGLDQLRPAVGKLGGACKSCHDDFRAKDF